jgi:hypothetical protein
MRNKKLIYISDVNGHHLHYLNIIATTNIDIELFFMDIELYNKAKIICSENKYYWLPNNPIIISIKDFLKFKSNKLILNGDRFRRKLLFLGYKGNLNVLIFKSFIRQKSLLKLHSLIFDIIIRFKGISLLLCNFNNSIEIDIPNLYNGFPDPILLTNQIINENKSSVLLIIGTINSRKRVKDALLFSNYKNLTLRLVGRGSELESKKHMLNNNYLDKYISNEDFLNEISNADYIWCVYKEGHGSSGIVPIALLHRKSVLVNSNSLISKEMKFYGFKIEQLKLNDLIVDLIIWNKDAENKIKFERNQKSFIKSLEF